jgi:Ser/Thr protein kinase RdoA (MazF antagonist)
MSLLQFRPRLTTVNAQQLAQNHYQLTAVATPLPSDRDQNFLLTTESGQKYVLKIANALEKRPMLELENTAMIHLAQYGIFCPQVVLTLSGETITTISQHNQTHFIRLVTHLPGIPLAEVEHTSELLVEIGRLLGQLSNALYTFDHPAAHRDFHWDMQQAHTVIRQYLPLIAGEERQSLVHHFLTQFETEVLPMLPHFRASVLYNDANDYNLLVHNGRLAVLDFGDMVYSRTVFDLAIGIAYALLSSNPYPGPTPERGRRQSSLSLEGEGWGEGEGALLNTAVAIFRAYHQVSPLTAVEIAHLYTLIAIRWCTSVAVAAHQMAQEPDNDYLAISQAGAWAALSQWRDIEPQTANRAFQAAGIGSEKMNCG